MAIGSGVTLRIWWKSLAHLAALFVASMVCHGELARDRPPTRHLTGFYLAMSVGGVLGGLFNALVAPLVFTGLTEYPLALILACLLQPPGEKIIVPSTGTKQLDRCLVLTRRPIHSLQQHLRMPVRHQEIQRQ